MTDINPNMRTVRQGDCAWSVAANNLKAKGKKASNAEIAKEMQRLAKLNNCASVDDFNNKFFSKVGSEFLIDGKNNAPAKSKSPAKSRGSVVSADSSVHLKPEDMTAIQDTTRPIRDIRRASKTYIQSKETAKRAEIIKINSLDTDTQRIIEYNKKHAKGNYVIIDKKTCRATVYNKEGRALDSYEVLLGQHKGDNLSTAYAKDPSKRVYTTVPGEFPLAGKTGTFGGTYYFGDMNGTFDPEVEMRPDAPGSGGKRKLVGGYQALHGTANPKVRNKFYGNGNLADNRQSMGCVNIPVDNLKEMEMKYGIKVGSTVYVLPEDKGNKLVLKEQEDGSVKFVTQYKNSEQNRKLAVVQQKIKSKKLQKSFAGANKNIAQQKEPPKKQDSVWYNPMTWFSET